MHGFLLLQKSKTSSPPRETAGVESRIETVEEINNDPGMPGDSGISSRDQETRKEDLTDTMADITDLSTEETDDCDVKLEKQETLRPQSRESVTTSESQPELFETVISKEPVGKGGSSDTLDRLTDDDILEEDDKLKESAVKTEDGLYLEEENNPSLEQNENDSHGDPLSLVSTLLSKVDLTEFGDHTPERSPEGVEPTTVIKKQVEPEFHDENTGSPLFVKNIADNNEDIENDDVHSVPTPGPIETPDVSGISFFPEDSEAQDLQSCNLSIKNKLASTKLDADTKTVSVCSESLSTLSKDITSYNTNSTDLAPYMVDSVTSDNKLPICLLPEIMGQKSPSPDNEKKNTENMPKKSPNSPKSHSSEKRRKHVRQNSYTLDHPSPVLVAMHAKQMSAGLDDYHQNDTLISESDGVRASTENLMPKPVQRKLDYDSEESSTGLKSDTISSNQDEHQEHFNNYLKNLSKMPVDADCERKREPFFGHIPIQVTPSASPNNSPINDSRGINNGMSGSSKSPNSGSKIEKQQGIKSSRSPNSETVKTRMVQASPEEEALRIQLAYFEQLKQKLLEQQQQQLATLVAQQQQQQMHLQQELLSQEQSLLQELSMNSGIRQNSMLNRTDAHLHGCNGAPALNEQSVLTGQPLSNLYTEGITKNSTCSGVPMVSKHSNTSLIDSPELATHITQRHNREKFKSGDKSSDTRCRDIRISPASDGHVSLKHNHFLSSNLSVSPGPTTGTFTASGAQMVCASLHTKSYIREL